MATSIVSYVSSSSSSTLTTLVMHMSRPLMAHYNDMALHSNHHRSSSSSSSSNRSYRSRRSPMMKAAAAAASSSSSSFSSHQQMKIKKKNNTTMTALEAEKRREDEEDANVVQVHTVKQFEEALEAAKSKLVVVEYAASDSVNSRKIYPAMVELSTSCPDAVFLLVMGDESSETEELCRRAKVEKVPHFVFYKNKEVVHEEAGIGPEELLGDVLYYGDPADHPIVQLHSRKELKDLIQEHSASGKLLVLDVGLKHCGPCVKVYPTVVKLARKMRDVAVFARIHGDENEELMDMLRTMDVVQVPTFLFIRSAKTLGRYVGSGRGELIGEILRYQGVRVTY